MKRYFFWKRLMMIVLFTFIFIVPISFIVMALWNNILVPVLHVAIINFWQALGIFALSKILFGGFPGRWGRHHDGRWNKEWGGGMHEKRKEMFEKWQTMSPEERQKFKQEWKSRCRGWRFNPGKEQETNPPAENRESAQ